MIKWIKRLGLLASILLPLTAWSFHSLYNGVDDMNFVEGIAQVVSAGNTTTLTRASHQFIQVTGTSTQTINLGDATNLVAGQMYVISNSSTGNVTVKDGGNAALKTILPGGWAWCSLRTNSISAGTWDVRITTGSSFDISGLTENASIANNDYIPYFDTSASGNRKISLLDLKATIIASGITDLTGDVSATGPGSTAATVNLVGGSSAANVHTAELLANAATSVNTALTIVKRDGSGNFNIGTITGALAGTASGNPPNSRLINTTAPITGGGDLSADRTFACNVASGSQPGCLSSTDWTTFNGKLGTALASAKIFVGNGSGVAAAVTPAGDVTIDNTGATAVALVGGSSASNVHTAELLANAATNLNTASTIVKRDGSGNFVFGTATGSITGHSSLDLALTGGTMSGAIAMGTSKITGMGDPTSAQDAATKTYVDSQLLQLNPAASVVAASTANVAGTYVNAVGGVCVGDTFTTTATTAFALDGNSPAVGARVLLKDQTSAFQRGVWTLTTQAVGGVSGAVLTRALDSDSAADFNSGQIVPIINGTVNAGASYYQTAVITTCSSDSQTWTQFQKASSAYASSTLTSANFYVGNSSNVATGVAASGDCSLSNAGAFTCTTLNSVAVATANTNSTLMKRDGSGNAQVTNLLLTNTSGSTNTFSFANGATSLAYTWPQTGPSGTQILQSNSSGVLSWAAVGGTGTVTSVAMTVPTGFSVSGSPITSGGTLAVSLSNETAATVWAGPTIGASAAAPTFRVLAAGDLPNIQGSDLQNVSIGTSNSSNALTIKLLGANGSDPSATNPVLIGFRNTTAGTGTFTSATATAATSVVVGSGATLGSASGASKQTFIYVYAINNAGTIELGVSGAPLLDEARVITTTATPANSPWIIYSTSTRSSVAARLIGRIKSPEATAGTWSTAPAEVATWPFAIVSRYFDDSTNWAVTGFGTPTNKSFQVKYNLYDSTVEVIGSFSSGTTTGVSATIDPPSNFNIDTNSITATSAVTTIGYFSRVQGIASGAVSTYPLFYDGSTNNHVYFGFASSSNLFTKSLANAMDASGTVESFTLKYPVVPLY